MKTIFVACLSLLFCGCSAVFSPQPIGDKPTNILSKQSEWEGTWVNLNGAITVKVVDGSNGVLKVGWIQDKDGDLKYRTAEVSLRDNKDWTFISIRDLDEANQNRYLWGRIKKEERAAILWGPDVEKFKTLVQDKLIPGTIDGGNVVLGNLSSSHLDLIRSQTSGVLFNWDQPLILIRLDK